MGAPQTLGSQWCRELSSPEWETRYAPGSQKGAVTQADLGTGALPKIQLGSHAQDPLSLHFSCCQAWILPSTTIITKDKDLKAGHRQIPKESGSHQGRWPSEYFRANTGLDCHPMDVLEVGSTGGLIAV